ncbi:hypothetical protein R3P38DRAFT_3222024 [Favolaschia claudopus]|uniref:Uncharacterized protein n=1 Tax=Favolaschia claudopus TaxID=2862362 RepID=A0AAV9ZYX7_9AGAR
MDDFPIDKDSDYAVPTWGLVNGITFGSFLASPAAIIPQVVDYLDKPPLVLHPDTPLELKKIFDFRKKPILYNATEHWLGWCPSSELVPAPFSEGLVDPLAFAFASGYTPLTMEYTDIPGGNSEASDDEHTLRAPAGYSIDEDWTSRAVWTGEKLYRICHHVASRSPWYCYYGDPERVGSLPPEPSFVDLSLPCYSFERAAEVVDEAKSHIISCLGFLIWFDSIADLFTYGLDEEDTEYIRSLRLEDRRKIGVIYHMPRDAHESNFLHLIAHNVPIHFAWTSDMSRSDRFFRLSPEFWGEARAMIERDPRAYLDYSNLPSYQQWRVRLDESDWFFQFAHAGRMGQPLNSFKPGADHGVVDFTPFGLRILRNANEIRAISERFKVFEKRSLDGSPNMIPMYIYFRQNPRQLDEPPMARVQPEMHNHDLSTFAQEYTADSEIEKSVFFERTVIVRERVKNVHAPRVDRFFSTYSGAQTTMRGPTSEPRREPPAIDEPRAKKPRSEGAEVQITTQVGDQPLSRDSLLNRMGIETRHMEDRRKISERVRANASSLYTSEWVRRMAGGLSSSGEPAIPGSDTLSDARSLASRGGEFRARLGNHEISRPGEAPAQSQGNAPTDVPQISAPVGPPPVLTETEARQGLLAWGTLVLETDPPYPPIEGVSVNLGWLTNSRLAFKDPRSYWRFKLLAVRNPSVENFEDLMFMAIRHGIPFEIYVLRSDVRKFNDAPIPFLQQSTLSSLYQPGYVDEPLLWNKAGVMATYTDYLAKLSALLSRPESIAFVRMGGVLRYIAELYNREIVQTFANGPSLQVTHFDKGETKLFDNDLSEFYTADSVSPSEISLLIGRIPGNDQESETTLWPPPEIFESSTWVVRGYLSARAFKLLESVRKEIFGAVPSLCWRNRGAWNQFFRAPRFNSTRAKDRDFDGIVPSASNFEEGQRLFEKSYPVDWRDMNISDIVLPEVYEPIA